MPGATSPDNLAYPTVGDVPSPRLQITALADSVQAALTSMRTAASTTRVEDFYGLAADRTLTTPKAGDTYQESDGRKRLWRYDGSNWNGADPTTFIIFPTSVSAGAGTATLGTDGIVTFSNITNPSGGLFIDGAFTSRFRKYVIDLEVDAFGSVASSVFMGFRAAGASIITADYSYAHNFNNNTTPGSAALGAQSTIQIPAGVNSVGTGGRFSSALEVMRPADASSRTFVRAHTVSIGSLSILDTSMSGYLGLVQAVDGIRFIPTNGATISGSVRITGIL